MSVWGTDRWERPGDFSGEECWQGQLFDPRRERAGVLLTRTQTQFKFPLGDLRVGLAGMQDS